MGKKRPPRREGIRREGTRRRRRGRRRGIGLVPSRRNTRSFEGKTSYLFIRFVRSFLSLCFTLCFIYLFVCLLVCFVPLFSFVSFVSLREIKKRHARSAPPHSRRPISRPDRFVLVDCLLAAMFYRVVFVPFISYIHYIVLSLLSIISH